MLTHTSLNNPPLLAQATAPDVFEDGYTVTKTRQTQKAPPGWVGQKTTDRVTRVGNKPETAGNRDSTLMISGGKVLQCPTSDGVVPGDAEFAFVHDPTVNEADRVRMVHAALRVEATLKGHVGDDAKVQYVELDASIVSERGGNGCADLGPTPTRADPICP